MLQSIASAVGALLAALLLYSNVYKSWQKKLSRCVTKCVKEDWIQIDQLYLARVTDRKHNLKTFPEKCHAVNNETGARAINELFENIVKHLPTRFPTMFELDTKDQTFRNLVTGANYELHLIRTEPRQMLEFLSENVEEDLYLMCPDQEGIFSLQGFISCFTNGFLAKAKLGLSMRDIHGPVPGLEENIGKGIDRFMKSMRGGTIVQRMGWSLQFSGPDLLRTGGNNFYPDIDQTFSDLSEPQDLSQCYLRVERQTLTRLPESKAIVFGIRHYVTPLEEVKKEGNGEQLADAIQTMPEKLGYYKRRPFWQRDVNAFLRESPKGGWAPSAHEVGNESLKQE
ncbi:MAG: hypothetical protein Q9181_006485 [Wetmoreana brouardii]